MDERVGEFEVVRSQTAYDAVRPCLRNMSDESGINCSLHIALRILDQRRAEI